MESFGLLQLIEKKIPENEPGDLGQPVKFKFEISVYTCILKHFLIFKDHLFSNFGTNCRAIRLV